MGYLIGEIWIWLLITFVVGVIIGWLVWGRSAPRNTLTDLERKLTNALERCQVCESEKAELAAAVDAAEATKAAQALYNVLGAADSDELSGGVTGVLGSDVRKTAAAKTDSTNGFDSADKDDR